MSPVDHSEDDVVLALALATGLNCVAAAEQAKVSERTARRKLADPAFRALIAQLRGEMVACALGRMASHLTHAADQLCSLLDDPDPGIRLRAVRTMFMVVIRLRDSVDLADRIYELECELAQRQGTLP